VNDHRSALFVGLGSSHGDDQIGWLVADQLASVRNPPAPFVVRKAAVPLDLLDWLAGVRFLGICDAAETSSPAGSLKRWEWNAEGEMPPAHETSLPTQTFFPMLNRSRTAGSHDFELSQVLDLAARLNRLPSRIVIWTVSAVQFEPGQALSHDLQRDLARICDEILSEPPHA